MSNPTDKMDIIEDESSSSVLPEEALENIESVLKHGQFYAKSKSFIQFDFHQYVVVILLFIVTFIGDDDSDKESEIPPSHVNVTPESMNIEESLEISRPSSKSALESTHHEDEPSYVVTDDDLYNHFDDGQNINSMSPIKATVNDEVKKDVKEAPKMDKGKSLKEVQKSIPKTQSVLGLPVGFKDTAIKKGTITFFKLKNIHKRSLFFM